jgi:WD domain, G-beta repeat
MTKIMNRHTTNVPAAAESRRRFEAMHAAFDIHQKEFDLDGSSDVVADSSFRVPPVPYPGLRSFTAQEGGIFFGRERNVDEVRERLAHLNFAVLLGGSGSGKSSLVRAGLVPRLNSTKGIPGRSGNWYAAEFRPRLHPLKELIDALANLVCSQFPDQGPGGADYSGHPDRLALSKRLQSEFDVSSEIERVDKERSVRAEALCTSLFEFVEHELDERDRIATHALRSGRPSLLLVVDQFEEVFRPEANADTGARELLDLLIATYAKLERERDVSVERRSGLFVVITMRSEELHRCAEHPALRINVAGKAINRSLADVINGSMYLLDLLDPQEDQSELREAIVGPAKRVFADWGIRLNAENADAPFAPGVVDWLLEGANKLSTELKHRPDQLPLLQHALQSIWLGAMDDWTRREEFPPFEIRKEHLQYGSAESAKLTYPDLVACLDYRADLTAREGIERLTRDAVVETESTSLQTVAGELICSSFRALAQRDDRGNWARRFADPQLIAQFLPTKALVQRLSFKDKVRAIHTVLSSFVSRGYLVVKHEYYDISHEALIRNWKQYQEWLRDPEEIAQALVRSVADLDPRRIEQSSDPDEELLGGLPSPVCETLEKAFKYHELPQTWVVEQVLPLVVRPGVSNRWGSTSPVEIVSHLGDLVGRAQSVRVKRATERQRRERNRVLALGGSIIAALALVGAFFMWQTTVARRTANINHAKSIALHAEDTLDHEGPAQAILIAMQASKTGLPNITENERVIYRSLRQLREKRRIRTAGLRTAAISPKGDVIAGLSQAGHVTFWRATDGKVLGDYQLAVPAVRMYGIRWSPNGEQLAIGVEDQLFLLTPCSHAAIRVLFSSCGQIGEQDKLQRLGSIEASAGPGKFSRDGELIITAFREAEARVWKIRTGEHIDLGVGTAYPSAIALAPDGRRAAVGTRQGEVKIVDLETKETTLLKAPSESTSGPIMSLDFGGASVLVVSSQYGQVWLLDVANRKWEHVRGQDGVPFQTAFSDDGRFIATTSSDGAVRLWQIDAFNQVADKPDVLRGHGGPVLSVQFDHGVTSIVSASVDNVVRLWSVSAALSPRVEHALVSRGLPGTGSEWRPPKDSTGPSYSEDGFTVRAFNAESGNFLALFEPMSSTEPVSVWGRQQKWQWRDVAIHSDDHADRGTVSAVLSNGQTYSWTFFKTLEALTRFAEENIPFEGDKRIQLNEKEYCKLGLAERRDKKACEIETD